MNKVLVLKKVNKYFKDFTGFSWPESGKVKSEDWCEDTVITDGFCGFLWGVGNYKSSLLEDERDHWLVLEVEKDKIVCLDWEVKFPECEVIYYGDKESAARVILKRKPNSICPGLKKRSKFVNKQGTKYWYFDGLLHKEDGPVIEYTNGRKEYWVKGKCHREDGPAVEYIDEYKESYKAWYKNGKLHREDGPAVQWTKKDTEYREWWLNGELQRKNGPKIEIVDI